jgi:hypothetical protein
LIQTLQRIDEIKSKTNPTAKIPEKVEGTANPRTSSVNSNSSSDRSYLEVIDIDDDYLNPYQPIETNNQSDILHKYCTLNMVSSPEYEATTQPEAKIENYC